MGSMHPVQVIAVTGGKGGVGKTNVSVNLSLALAELGRRVMLLDADLGLANVDVLLGLSPKRTLADVIEGRCELRDVLLQGPGGVRIVPAASGTQNMVHLAPAQHAGLIQAFSEIGDNLDVLVIDTAAGIGDSVVSFVRAAQEVLLVVCDEPTSITDAYALIKLLNRDYGMNRFRVLANMAQSPQEGRNLFAKLTKVTDRFWTSPYNTSVPCLTTNVYARRCRSSGRSMRPSLDPSVRWPSRPSRRRSTAGRCLPTRAGTGVFRRASGAAYQRRTGTMNASGFKMYSRAARDAQYELVERYAPLVKRIAYHLLARLPANVQVEDLIQAGMIGLLEVANKYDASKGASFETYAGIRIRGAMLDEVRKGIGRRVRYTATPAWSATRYAPWRPEPVATLKIMKLLPNSN